MHTRLLLFLSRYYLLSVEKLGTASQQLSSAVKFAQAVHACGVHFSPRVGSGQILWHMEFLVGDPTARHFVVLVHLAALITAPC